MQKILPVLVVGLWTLHFEHVMKSDSNRLQGYCHYIYIFSKKAPRSALDYSKRGAGLQYDFYKSNCHWDADQSVFRTASAILCVSRRMRSVLSSG